MNIRDLEYFIAVAETGKFNEAAKRCFVSQPTLSGQLRKLEEELGSALFERTTRQVRLTDFGREALELARSAIFQIRLLEQKAMALKDPFVGPVSLGAFPTLGPWFIPRISEMLHRQYPKVEFYLSEEKSPVLQDQLLSGSMDAVFLAMPQTLAGVEVVPLFSEMFKLAIPQNHPWHRRKSITEKDLANQELLLLEDGHCLRDQALDLCHKYGAHEKGYFRATGLETLRQMVRMEMGMTLMPEMAIPPHGETGIRYLTLETGDAHREIALCYRKTHPRKALFEDLIHHLRQFLKDALPVEVLDPDWVDTPKSDR